MKNETPTSNDHRHTFDGHRHSLPLGVCSSKEALSWPRKFSFEATDENKMLVVTCAQLGMIESIEYFLGYREWRTVTMMLVVLKQPKEALSFAHFARMAGKTRLCKLIVSTYHKLWELRS